MNEINYRITREELKQFPLYDQWVRDTSYLALYTVKKTAVQGLRDTRPHAMQRYVLTRLETTPHGVNGDILAIRGQSGIKEINK